MYRKILLWAPRILSILFILLLLMLSFDVFFESDSFGDMLIGFFMHNIPTLVFIVVLYFSWRRPAVGGIFYILAGAFYLGLMRNSEDSFIQSLLFSMALAGPVFITGILYLIDWKVNKRG